LQKGTEDTEDIDDIEGNEDGLADENKQDDDDGTSEKDGASSQKQEGGPKAAEAMKEGDKFYLRKLVYKPSRTKDGKPYNKPVFKTLGEFIGDAPTIDDIESIYQPLWGGGEYLVIDASSKKLAKKFILDGIALDPESNEAVQGPRAANIPAPAYQPPAAGPVQVAPAYQAPAPVPVQVAPVPTMERISQVMASGQVKAVEQLSNLADRLMASGDTENLQKVIDTLGEIATGKKTERSEDKFMTFLMADRLNQQNLLNQLLTEGRKDKGASPNEVMVQTMSMVKEMMGVAREIAPQGEDVNVAMVREIGDVVKNSMTEVTDTIVKVTGSGELKEAPANVTFKCSKCGAPVQPSWVNCPMCGMKFTGLVSPANLPMTRQGVPVVETFRPPVSAPAPALRVPKEVRDKLGYLRNMAVFIRDGHDPVPKGSGLFKMCGPDERVGLLFSAEFGYKNLMRLANPYRDSPDIPDREAVFKIVESEAGKEWLTVFFNSIKEAAKEEGVSLTDGDREHFLDELNKVSSVKFNFKPRAAQVAPAAQMVKTSSTRVVMPAATIKPEPDIKEAVPMPPADLEVEIPTPIKGPNGKPLIARIPMATSGPKAAMTTCPICGDMVLSSGLKDHLFSNHPKSKTEKPSFHDIDESELPMNESEPEEDGLT
jgi:hypothetical protein